MQSESREQNVTPMFFPYSSADVIERNLKKGSDKSTADFSDVIYEAYGPGGTGESTCCASSHFLLLSISLFPFLSVHTGVGYVP
jgi:hypothetical protein